MLNMLFCLAFTAAGNAGCVRITLKQIIRHLRLTEILTGLCPPLPAPHLLVTGLVGDLWNRVGRTGAEIPKRTRVDAISGE